MPKETLLELFTRYNHDLWPLHVVAYALGVLLVALLLFAPGRADRTVAVGLGALWIWLGLGFQAMYATDIDTVLGVAYAVLFVAQGLLLTAVGITGELTFTRSARTVRQRVGWAALAYALLVYPLIGIALGHGWPESPLFGMAPCPTTIATFGFLLLARLPVRRLLLVIPLLWAVLAPPAALSRGVWEDTGLIVFGLAAAIMLLRRPPAPIHQAEHAGEPVGDPGGAPLARAGRVIGAARAGTSSPERMGRSEPTEKGASR
jgi:hypothetical protein